MKHCPTCGSSYTDDTLVYCLQDGATLRPQSERSNPLSMVATLRDDADLSEETRAISNSSAPTVEISGSALPTTLYQESRPTAPVTGGGSASASAPSTQSPRDTTRVIMTTVVITLLLLAVGGVGAWLLFRGGGDGRGRERRAAEENTGGAVSNDSADAPNTVPPGTQGSGNNRPDKGGRWFVVLGSFPKEELNRADERLEAMKRQGFDARMISSDDYPNFKPGLWLIAIGPTTRNQAEEVLNQVRPKIKDAYTKSGW